MLYTHTNTFLHLHRYDEDASCNVTLSLCASREYLEVPITTQRSSLLTNSSAKLVNAFNIYIYIYMDKVTCIDTCPQPRTPLTTCAYRIVNTK